jgi:EAL domain-containing protein (putative c-di-GMP-specific phosphodiesterase class I)
MSPGKSKRAAEAMLPTDFLEALSGAAGKPVEHSSALLCVMLDSWQDLRSRFGYAGLYSLRSQLSTLLVDALGSGARWMPLNESALVFLLPPGKQSVAALGEGLVRQVAAHEFSMQDDSIALSVTICGLGLGAEEAADAALVRVVSQSENLRQAGGNQMCSLDEQQADDLGTDDRRALLALLMQSLREDRVRVVFQPLLPTSGEDVQSFQMLPRLKGSDGQLIPAAEFLPVAQEAGLVATLDRWMLSAAIQMLERRYRGQHIRLFLSQSEVLLSDADRRKRLLDQLGSAETVAGRLVLDFRLPDVMAHLKGSEDQIAALRQVGVESCFSMVDDHSNWALLTGRLRPDYVRMSPAFVRRLAASDSLERDLDQVCAPAREHGVRIILPMIEDAEAAATLWRKGVDFLQGNLIQAAEETIQINA